MTHISNGGRVGRASELLTAGSLLPDCISLQLKSLGRRDLKIRPNASPAKGLQSILYQNLVAVQFPDEISEFLQRSARKWWAVSMDVERAVKFLRKVGPQKALHTLRALTGTLQTSSRMNSNLVLPCPFCAHLSGDDLKHFKHCPALLGVLHEFRLNNWQVAEGDLRVLEALAAAYLGLRRDSASQPVLMFRWALRSNGFSLRADNRTGMLVCDEAMM